jgi:hypothetical protein
MALEDPGHAVKMERPEHVGGECPGRSDQNSAAYCPTNVILSADST